MATSFQTYPAGEKRRGTVRLTRHDDADMSRPEVAPMGARRSWWKHGRRGMSAVSTVHRNYKIATRLFSQITPKFI